MFDHVTVRVSDHDASKRFYATVLAPLGHAPTWDRPDLRMTAWGDLLIAADGAPVSANVHIAFAASSRTEVDAFHRAGVEAGYRDNGAPGLRPIYHAGYYGAFLLDPDGNNVEAVVHERDG